MSLCVRKVGKSPVLKGENHNKTFSIIDIDVDTYYVLFTWFCC